MNGGKKLVGQLCQVVKSFLCQPGTAVEIIQCVVGPHVFAKGSSQPICTIKMIHGQIYNLEFVYKYWCHILRTERFLFSPVFIISNNGLAVTLKCFLCEPREIQGQFGQRMNIESDVNLYKNASIVLSQDDFMKFKTNVVFAKDLNVCSSMVVCRTYLTETRQTLQFLVVKAKNPKRISAILQTMMATLGYDKHRSDEDLCKFDKDSHTKRQPHKENAPEDSEPFQEEHLKKLRKLHDRARWHVFPFQKYMIRSATVCVLVLAVFGLLKLVV
ncbi:nuclear egress membrane protein [Vespertilionid gammaherpesvirus 1]|uniref:Nuclear egress membrane protein n=1 Tax=Vespertilionid gammaherpesvirus 1 TaxID=2560830 RepID=A0A0X9WR44_9GAMA|nr:nuclear egress membrane protein [Myotis gammaherpesvirus 8]AMA67424.1 nuclear egress membrane protein [Vespertilionid gammaherpesvirus 1]